MNLAVASPKIGEEYYEVLCLSGDELQLAAMELADEFCYERDGACDPDFIHDKVAAWGLLESICATCAVPVVWYPKHDDDSRVERWTCKLRPEISRDSMYHSGIPIHGYTVSIGEDEVEDEISARSVVGAIVFAVRHFRDAFLKEAGKEEE